MTAATQAANRLLSRDLAAIFADAAALPGVAPNALLFAGREIPCEAAEPREALAPEWAGECGEKQAVVWALADPGLPAAGSLVTYAGSEWRVVAAETAPDGLEVSLTLEGLRR